MWAFRWLVTLFHISLCVFVTICILFAKQMFVNGLIFLLLLGLYVAIRFLKRCWLDDFEMSQHGPGMVEIGKAHIVEDYHECSLYVYEQIVVGTLLLVQASKIGLLSVYPMYSLF